MAPRRHRSCCCAAAGRPESATPWPPSNPWLGVMLPCSPLHLLLLELLGEPVVATSGNRSGEPLATTRPSPA